MNEEKSATLILPPAPSSDRSGALLRLQRIRFLADKLAGIFNAREQIGCRGLSREDLTEFFLGLDDGQQLAAQHSLEEYYATSMQLESEGISFRHHRDAVGAHLRRHRVRVSDDVAAIMDKHDVVELYDFHLVQTYRSPNFLKFTDRSLEELAVLPYYMMFTRSEKLSDRCIKNCLAMLTRAHEGPMWDFLERHIVKEKGSARVSSVNSIVAAPVYSERDGEIMGLVHVFDVEAHSELKLMN